MVQKSVFESLMNKIISSNQTFSSMTILIGQKKFTGLNFKVLPHLECVDFIFGLHAIMKDLNMYIQPSHNLLLIGD